MLGQRLKQHPDTEVYLINTGWSGGAYGIGDRISIKHTRAMVTAALSGALTKVRLIPHPIFRVLVPDQVPDVPSEILNPRNAWGDPAAYDQQAHELAKRFVENFSQFATARPDIVAAGPIVG